MKPSPSFCWRGKWQLKPLAWSSTRSRLFGCEIFSEDQYFEAFKKNTWYLFPWNPQLFEPGFRLYGRRTGFCLKKLASQLHQSWSSAAYIIEASDMWGVGRTPKINRELLYGQFLNVAEHQIWCTTTYIVNTPLWAKKINMNYVRQLCEGLPNYQFK